MSKKIMFLALTVCFASLFTSCGKDDPEPPNEEELITTLRYTLLPQSGGTPVVLTYTDLDGDGPETPTIEGGTLSANAQYTGSVELLNEAESPAEVITAEIQEEDDEHQFFFTSTVSGVAISYTDEDDDGNPVGLSSTLTTAAAGSGNIRIILRHKPMKSADNVSDGDITNAGGDTDIDVTLPIDVE